MASFSSTDPDGGGAVSVLDQVLAQTEPDQIVEGLVGLCIKPEREENWELFSPLGESLDHLPSHQGESCKISFCTAQL